MGGKGGGGSAPLMLPPQQQDNSELIMAMMQAQNQQNQQMMQALSQMMMASGQQQQQPIVIQTPQTAQKAEYQPQNFDALRDRLHDKASQNVSGEASQRVGRSKTIISSPRMDSTKPKTTADRQKSLLTEEDEDKK